MARIPKAQLLPPDVLTAATNAMQALLQAPGPIQTTQSPGIVQSIPASITAKINEAVFAPMSETRTEFLPEDLDLLALQVRKACDGLGFSILFTATGSSIADPLLMVEWRSMHGIRHIPSRVRTHCYARTFREAFSYILEYERRAKEYGEEATEKWHKDQQKAIERHAIPKGR